MMPVAAVLFDTIGVARILLLQAGLSLLAAAVESLIRIQEENRLNGSRFSFLLWRQDLTEAAHYLKQEKGLCSIYSYMVSRSAVIGAERQRALSKSHT